MNQCFMRPSLSCTYLVSQVSFQISFWVSYGFRSHAFHILVSSHIDSNPIVQQVVAVYISFSWGIFFPLKRSIWLVLDPIICCGVLSFVVPFCSSTTKDTVAYRPYPYRASPRGIWESACFVTLTVILRRHQWLVPPFSSSANNSSLLTPQAIR